jgi:hypothetical protein
MLRRPTIEASDRRLLHLGLRVEWVVIGARLPRGARGSRRYDTSLRDDIPARPCHPIPRRPCSYMATWDSLRA